MFIIISWLILFVWCVWSVGSTSSRTIWGALGFAHTRYSIWKGIYALSPLKRQNSWIVSIVTLKELSSSLSVSLKVFHIPLLCVTSNTSLELSIGGAQVALLLAVYYCLERIALCSWDYGPVWYHFFFLRWWSTEANNPNNLAKCFAVCSFLTTAPASPPGEIWTAWMVLCIIGLPSQFGHRTAWLDYAVQNKTYISFYYLLWWVDLSCV
jgi:hypothetical protein